MENSAWALSTTGTSVAEQPTSSPNDGKPHSVTGQKVTIRRSGRNNHSEPSQRSIQTTIVKANYTLNVKNALQKKFDNLNTPYDIRSLVTGGGTMLYLSTVGYELFKAAIGEHLPTKLRMYDVESKQTVDKAGNNTMTSYKVKYKPKPSLAYTLNFYHTKSSTLVNGKGMDKFLNEDVPMICKAITQANIDTQRLTKILQEKLLAPIKDPGTPKPKVKNGPVKPLLQISKAVTSDSSPSVITLDPVIADITGNLARFNKYRVDPTCPVCGTNVESLNHFILHQGIM